MHGFSCGMTTVPPRGTAARRRQRTWSSDHAGPSKHWLRIFSGSVSAGSRADAAAGARAPSMQAPRHRGQHPHGRCGAGRGCGAAHRDMPDMCSLGLCGDLLDCQLDCQRTASVLIAFKRAPRLPEASVARDSPGFQAVWGAFTEYVLGLRQMHGRCAAAQVHVQRAGAWCTCSMHLVVEAQEGDFYMATLCAQGPRSCSVRAGATYTGPLRID